MKKMLLSLTLVFGLAAVAAPAYDSYGQYPVATKAGELQAIDIANRHVIINGIRYVVALDVDVTINDGFGAFTMLTVGMYVHYDYEAIADDHRRILIMQAYTGQAGREAA